MIDPAIVPLLRELADRIEGGEPVSLVLVWAESPDRLPEGCTVLAPIVPADLCRRMRGVLRQEDQRLAAVQVVAEVLDPEPDLPFEAPHPPTPRQSGLRLIEGGRQP